MPTPRKPAERRQRSNTTDLAPTTTTTTLRPPPLEFWHPEVVESWTSLWSTPLAKHFAPTDVAALQRLFTYRSLLVDAVQRFSEAPMSVGSTGQPVVSPWAAEVHRLETSISKLEQQFGLTPLARLRLGVTYEEGVSLVARNRELLEAFLNAQAD